MKNIKSQKGAISLFVVLSMLFFLAFMLGVFSITARRNAAQLEAVRETAKIYSSGVDANTLYDSMVSSTSGVAIPITTIDQLKDAKRLAEGTSTTETVNYTINGKLYSYKKGESYYLANDIILDMKSEINGKNASDLKLYDYILYKPSTYKISLNNHNIYYKLSDGTLWKCIFYQAIGTKSAYNNVSKSYNDSKYAGKQASANLYSILDNGVEQFAKTRNTTNGTTYNYEFLLMYDNYISSGKYVFNTDIYNRWGQNNNPAKEKEDTTSNTLTPVAGYTTNFAGASTSLGSTNFCGLALSSHSNAFLEANVGNTSWWYTVGSVGWYSSDNSRGIPATQNTATTMSQTANECLLFVRAK